MNLQYQKKTKRVKLKVMNWQKGTIFSTKIWGRKCYWIILSEVDERRCDVFRLWGYDPRIFDRERTFNRFLKSYFDYDGRIENNIFLKLLKFWYVRFN
jgi:hypothetical protein